MFKVFDHAFLPSGRKNVRLTDIFPRLQQVTVIEHLQSVEQPEFVEKAGCVSLEEYVRVKEGNSELEVSIVCTCRLCIRSLGG